MNPDFTAPKKARTTVLLEPTAQIQVEAEVFHALSEAMQNLQQIDLGLIRKSKLDKINGNIFLSCKNHCNYVYQSINQSVIVNYYYIQELRNNNNYNRLSNVNCNMYAIIINTIIVIVRNIIVMYCCNNNHLPILM